MPVFWKKQPRSGDDYVLLLENGKEALFLPGGKEFFTLKRYREEVGKEFSKIILYLCTRSDFDTSEESRSGFSPYSSTSRPTVKTGDHLMLMVIQNTSGKNQIAMMQNVSGRIKNATTPVMNLES